jgi:hypothetical protein
MGLGKDLPAQRNIFYQPIKVPPGYAWNAVDTIGASVSAFFNDEEFFKDKTDPVILELRRLGMDNPNLGHLDEEDLEFNVRMPPRVTYKESNGKLIPYKMTVGEYDKLLKFMQGPIPVPMYGGRDFYGVVKYLATENPTLSDESKKVMIKEAYAAHLKYAKEQLKFVEPEIEQKWQEINKKRIKKLQPLQGLR